jgi:acetyl coenzyme A synthetase (ADP forming)-like protein
MSFDALFRPRAVAVIGASSVRDGVGRRVLQKILAGGFRGPVFPVHPHARSIASVAAVPSIEQLPADVDLAVVAVPAAQVPAVADACGRKGIRGLLVLSAGFAEAGEAGRRLEDELRRIVRGHGMRMVGPNCLGMITTDPEVALDATFAPVHPLAGDVAMASQSGALGIAILETARELGLGFSAFVSMGNKTDVSGNDLLEVWERDPRTRTILLYLESLGNPRRFATIARRVSRTKPILAVKSGRSGAGLRAAGSHTAALAAPERCVDALLSHAGVLRVTTLEEMFDVATLLATQPLPRGPRVAILTNAGGPGILCADACEAERLVIPDLGEGVRARLAQRVPTAASVRNPVDLGATASADDFRRSLAALLDDDGVDAVVVIFVSAGVVDTDGVAKGVKAGRAEAASGRSKPIVVCWLGHRGTPAALKSDEESIPSYRFPESAARARARAAERSEWLLRPEGVVPQLAGFREDALRDVARRALERRGAGWLTPEENEELLAAAGLPILRSFLCRTVDEARAAAVRLGGPVAVKLASTTLVHKSEWKGVHLDLRGPAEAAAAMAAIEKELAARGRRGEMLGVTVAPMAGAGVDTIVGAVTDPSFGPLLAFGLGGIATELVGDVAFRRAPLTDVDALRMVRSVRGHALLAGYRGAPPADEGAVVDVVLRVAQLVDRVPEIVELDLNPVRVFTKGDGASVLDARIRVAPADAAVPPSRDGTPH